jgi:hypothetical protein
MSDNESSLVDQLETYKGPAMQGRHDAISRIFDDTDALLTFVRTVPTKWVPKTRGIGIADWVDDMDGKLESGTRTWDDALRLARQGWADGRRLLVAAESRQIRTGHARTRQHSFDIAGAIPDIPRYLCGDPEHMMDFMPSNNGRKPIISVYVSPMCPLTTTSQRRANWGAALLSWLEAEEIMGFRVEINVIYVSYSNVIMVGDTKNAPHAVVKFRLKSATEQPSIDGLAFWLMHDAAHRRLQFAVRERMQIGPWYREGAVYGRAVTDKETILAYVEENHPLLVLGDGASTVEEGLRMIDRDLAHWRTRIEGVV